MPQMSELRILRRSRVQACTVGTSASSSSAIRMDDMTTAIAIVRDAASDATMLTIWVAHAADHQYVPLVAADGGAAVVSLQTAGSHAYALPAAVAAARYVKLVSDADIGTAATVSVSVKS